MDTHMHTHCHAVARGSELIDSDDDASYYDCRGVEHECTHAQEECDIRAVSKPCVKPSLHVQVY